MSPEIVKKEEYCPMPADIWAFAVIIMRMRSGILPFTGNISNKVSSRANKNVGVDK